MDSQAAKEYHALLWKHVAAPRSLERAWWIPLVAVSGYFAFGHMAGAAFGLVIGWAITSLHMRLDQISSEQWQIELLRHAHEYTDEAEAGKRMYEIQAAVEKVSRKWWQSK